MTPPTPHHRIRALARTDKWYLGSLDGVLWAPPFPRRPDRPGFWDPVHLLHQEVGPCFSVALLDDEGTEIPLPSPHPTQPPAPRWRPGSLTAEWLIHGNHAATETRQVLPGGILESSWTLPRAMSACHLVAFTAQPADSVPDFRVSDRGVKWLRTVSDRADREMAIEMELHGSLPPTWRRVLPSEGGAFPDWPLTPFAEEGIGSDRGGDRIARPSPSDDIGVIWIAVAIPLAGAENGKLALRLRLTPHLPTPVRPKAEPPSNTPPTPPPGPPSSPPSPPSPPATPTSTATSTTASTASASTASRDHGATSAIPASPRAPVISTSPSPTAHSAT